MLSLSRLGCKHCVLVGDPNQLPATVFSQVRSTDLLYCVREHVVRSRFRPEKIEERT